MQQSTQVATATWQRWWWSMLCMSCNNHSLYVIAFDYCWPNSQWALAQSQCLARM